MNLRYALAPARQCQFKKHNYYWSEKAPSSSLLLCKPENQSAWSSVCYFASYFGPNNNQQNIRQKTKKFDGHFVETRISNKNLQILFNHVFIYFFCNLLEMASFILPFFPIFSNEKCVFLAILQFSLTSAFSIACDWGSCIYWPDLLLYWKFLLF